MTIMDAFMSLVVFFSVLGLIFLPELLGIGRKHRQDRDRLYPRDKDKEG